MPITQGSLSKQRGAVLLAIMLVLVVSASFVLVSKLNANVRELPRRSSSISLLKEAKAALIGYALTYPERNPANPVAGPGYLPCPDLDNDGDAEGGCALAGPVNFTVGRFPYETLEVADLRDASGERLWYALSDNYRNFAGLTPLNSDTPGELQVDGVGDIVAVILAPGSALGGQSRSIDPLDPANYLEDDNADADVNYVTRAAGQFNDVLVTITRQELMQAVEKRVLGDVAQAMDTYQAAYNAYPWLSTFADPSASVYRGQATTMEGHLPFHWAADPDSISVGGGLNIVGRNPFSTTMALRWDNISNATISAPNNPFAWLGLVNFISDACLNDINDCDEGGLYPEITSIASAGNVDCTWVDAATAACPVVTLTVTRPFTSGPCALSVMSRTYTITFPQFTGTATITNPTAADVRRRDVNLNAVNPVFLPAQVNAIQIQDSLSGQVDVLGFFCANILNMVVDTRTLTFDADTEGSIAVNGLHFDIDTDGYPGFDANIDGDFLDPGDIAPIDAELPAWFTVNEWQSLIYLAYATGEPLPGDTTAGQDCVTLGNCINVTADGINYTATARAIAVSAGVDISAARPSGNRADYFEGDNATQGDNAFTKNDISTVNNDQTRIIATAP